MALIELKLDPSKRELTIFGIMLTPFGLLLGALVWWKFQAPTAARVICGLGGTVTGLFFAVPRWQLAIYRGWMYAAYPIGWTVSHVLMAIVFYLVITPIGLVMRLLGYDPMQRRLDRQAATYWVQRQPVTEVKRYFRQF